MKTRCQWCNNTYSSAGTYSNHIQKAHPEMMHTMNTTLPRRLRDTLGGIHDQDEELPSNEEPEIDLCDGPDDQEEPDVEHDSDQEEPDVENDSDIEHDSDEPPSSREQFPDKIIQFPGSYKAGEPIAELLFEQRSTDFNHVYPFLNTRDFKLARFFTESKVPKTRINDFFRDDIFPPSSVDDPTSRISFTSGHTLHKLTRKMTEDPS